MSAAARSVILASSCVCFALVAANALAKADLFTWEMRVYLMLTDMAFGWMLAGVDDEGPIMWLSSAWTEVEEKQPTSVSPLAWSPFSSHSAPLVFMDWFYWPQTWRFYTDLLRLRVVRTFTLFLLWVTFSCKTLETLSVNQGEFRNTLAQAPTQFSHCEPVAYTQN